MTGGQCSAVGCGNCTSSWARRGGSDGSKSSCESYTILSKYQPPPPNRSDETIASILLYIVANEGLLFVLGIKLWVKGIPTVGRFHAINPSLIAKHTLRYLVYIGVIPEAQGRGYTRRLVEHVTVMVCICDVSCKLLHLANSSVGV